MRRLRLQVRLYLGVFTDRLAQDPLYLRGNVMRLRHAGVGRHRQIHADRHARRQLLQGHILHLRTVVGGNRPNARRHVFIAAGLRHRDDGEFRAGVLLPQPLDDLASARRCVPAARCGTPPP